MEDWIKKFLTIPRATPCLLERLLEHESSFKATHKLLDWALDTEIEPEITIVLILRRACDVTEYLVRKPIFKVSKTASLLESLLQTCLPIHDVDKLLYWAITTTLSHKYWRSYCLALDSFITCCRGLLARSSIR